MSIEEKNRLPNEIYVLFFPTELFGVCAELVRQKYRQKKREGEGREWKIIYRHLCALKIVHLFTKARAEALKHPTKYKHWVPRNQILIRHALTNSTFLQTKAFHKLSARVFPSHCA